MRARLLRFAVIFLSFSSRLAAGPWSAQPLIGVVTEYASNPALAPGSGQSETHAALSVESPLYYNDDDLQVAVVPRARYGGNTGYSSLSSNYFHVDANAKWLNDLGALTITGSWYLDSSLLYAGELANGLGVRRETETADVNWQRALSERWLIQLDGNEVTTHYAQNLGSGGLVDYRDLGITPALSYAWNELTTVRILGGVSRYRALDGSTDSNTSSLQFGFDRHLDELWSLSANAGYSKSTNQFHTVFGTLESAQNSAVYSATLTRTTPRLTAIVSASRSLTPTGFAFLSRQDVLSGSLNYTRSERLSYAVTASWSEIADPTLTGVTFTRRSYGLDGAVTWHWTEQWVVVAHLNTYGQSYVGAVGQPRISPTSTGFSLQLSRQFYQTNQ